MEDVELELKGTTVRLMPQRTLFLPELKSLLLADLHLGKAATFRHHRIPIPDATRDDLERLSQAIERIDCERVSFLGDMLHSRHGFNDEMSREFIAFRERHSNVEFILIPGNHDRWLFHMPKEWRVEIAEPTLELGPFLLQHEPPTNPQQYTLCGHLHPKFRLAGPAGDTLKLHGFWLRESMLVLPAFSRFVDGVVVQPDESDRVGLVCEEAIHLLESKPRIDRPQLSH